MNRRLETKKAALEQRAIAIEIRSVGDQGEIEGYGSVFGVKDSYGDIVAAGAFSQSITAHVAAKTMPVMLWQHDAGEPIGIWEEMSEDGKGLRVKGRIILETERGKAAFALLKAGALRGLSIGFVSKEWNWDAETEIRTLTEIDLWEVSLVTFPANKEAQIDTVKAAVDQIETPKDAERELREAGFSRTGATAFVSRVMRLGVKLREAADQEAEAKSAADRLLKSLNQ